MTKSNRRVSGNPVFKVGGVILTLAGAVLVLVSAYLLFAENQTSYLWQGLVGLVVVAMGVFALRKA